MHRPKIVYFLAISPTFYRAPHNVNNLAVPPLRLPHQSCTVRMQRCLQSKMEQDLIIIFKEELEKSYCLNGIGSLLSDMALEVWGYLTNGGVFVTSAHRDLRRSPQVQSDDKQHDAYGRDIPDQRTDQRNPGGVEGHINDASPEIQLCAHSVSEL